MLGTTFGILDEDITFKVFTTLKEAALEQPSPACLSTIPGRAANGTDRDLQSPPRSNLYAQELSRTALSPTSITKM